jgi:hypothetical protein
LATSRSRNPQRILCEVYAKLLALVVEHWCAAAGQLAPARFELAQGRRTRAPRRLGAILAALDNLDRLLEVLDFTARFSQPTRASAPEPNALPPTSAWRRRVEQ